MFCTLAWWRSVQSGISDITEQVGSGIWIRKVIKNTCPSPGVTVHGVSRSFRAVFCRVILFRYINGLERDQISQNLLLTHNSELPDISM